MSRLAAFSLILSLTLACSSPKEDQAPTKSIFLTEEILELPLPENSSHFRMESSYYWDENDVQLLLYDLKTHSLHQLDVNSKKIVHSTHLDREGPKGISNRQMYGLLMEHPDSLFVFRGPDEIIQLNIQGDFVRQIPVDLQHSERLNISLYPESFFRKGNDFFIPSVPLTFQWNQLEIAEILETPSAIRFNPEENKLIALTKFDEGFIGSNLNKPLFPKFHQGPNGDVILAYNYKDITVIHTDQTQSVKTLKASMVPDEAPASSKNIFEDMDEFARIFNHSNIYSDLHYFENHKIMMRVVQLEEDLPEQANMSEYLPQQYALLFYDEDYEKLGEVILDKGKYNAKRYFSTPDGIYISLDHPQNKDLHEEIMRFQKIQIE